MPGAVDWTSVLVAAIAAAPGTLAALVAIGNRRRLRVPSGGTIGERVERTHELGTITVAGLKTLNGGTRHGTSADS